MVAKIPTNDICKPIVFLKNTKTFFTNFLAKEFKKQTIFKTSSMLFRFKHQLSKTGTYIFQHL